MPLLSFREAALGQPLQPFGYPGYHGAALYGQDFWLLTQRLGEGTARVHLDIHTDDLLRQPRHLRHRPGPGLPPGRPRLVTGDNWVPWPTGVFTGYTAGPGWDPVTGWGSPNAQYLVLLPANAARSGA